MVVTAIPATAPLLRRSDDDDDASAVVVGVNVVCAVVVGSVATTSRLHRNKSNEDAINDDNGVDKERNLTKGSRVCFRSRMIA